MSENPYIHSITTFVNSCSYLKKIAHECYFNKSRKLFKMTKMVDPSCMITPKGSSMSPKMLENIRNTMISVEKIMFCNVIDRKSVV